MALGTYGQLKTAVATWLHRTDLTDVIPDFVTLAEANIRKDVRCRAMEDSTAVTLVSTTLALPDEFLAVRRVVLDDCPQRYVTPEQFYPLRESLTDAYTINGESFVFQSSTGSLSIDYYAGFAPFVEESDTNWLLENYPEIYLFGALAEAAPFIGKDPTLYVAKYSGAVAKLMGSEQRAIGPLQVRPDIRLGAGA